MSSATQLASANGERKTCPPEYRRAVKMTMRHVEYQNGSRVAVEVTEEELDFLLMKAAAYDLDPLKGQIYATWRSGAIQVETTFDGLRTLAERTGNYEGQTPPQWYDPQEREWLEIWLKDEPPVAAQVGIRRRGFPEPLYVPVLWREFKQTQRNGELVAMWKEKPAHMLAKTAASLALRAAFPDEAGGLYTAEEMAGFGHGEAPSAPAGSPKRSTPRPQRAGSAGASNGEGPAAIVDAPETQPSGPPARPESRRTLAQALQSGDHAKLRTDLAAMLFDQQADRLTDEQTKRLAATLASAEQAGITAVELERVCKVGLRQADVALRAKALAEWIEERQKRISGEQLDRQAGEPGKPAAAPAPEADAPPPGESPATLVEPGPGPQPSS